MNRNIVLKQCADNYNVCKLSCSIERCGSCLNKTNVCEYVCEDKFRRCVADTANRYGGNENWPFEKANSPATPYSAVRDIDTSDLLETAAYSHSYSHFKPKLYNPPFNTPQSQIYAGFIGDINRAFPYHFLNGKYNTLIKNTGPACRDPIYY